MKTIYTAVFGALLVAPVANAQITLLQAYHEPTVGVHGNVAYDSSGVVPKSTGTGQMWVFTNFTMKSGAAATKIGTYIVASSAPNASMFPGATLADNDG